MYCLLQLFASLFLCIIFIILFVSFLQNSFTIILSVHLILKLLLMEENGQKSGSQSIVTRSSTMAKG